MFLLFIVRQQMYERKIGSILQILIMNNFKQINEVKDSFNAAHDCNCVCKQTGFIISITYKIISCYSNPGEFQAGQ